MEKRAGTVSLYIISQENGDQQYLLHNFVELDVIPFFGKNHSDADTLLMTKNPNWINRLRYMC